MVALALMSGLGTRDSGVGREAIGAEEASTSREAWGAESRVPSPESRRQSPEPGSDLTIYLVTMGNGTRIWERFGHNAIRIVDATRGTDSVYNWGTFDFAQP